MRESAIEKALKDRAKALGGECRKVAWVGRSGAPDRLVMLPPAKGPSLRATNTAFWVELKAPGKKPEPHQLREHGRMRAMGQRVLVIDSLELIDHYFPLDGHA
jgi:hypothetical protein